MSTQARAQALPFVEPKYMVFNAADLGDSVEVFGTGYVFPPNDVARCLCREHDPEVTGRPDSNVGVHAAYEWPRDEDTRKLITDGPKKIAGDGTATASEVARHLVGPQCRGDKGYVILHGTPAEQDRQKRAAREVWVARRLEEVEAEISAWESYVMALRQASPGTSAPPQPPKVRDAYTFRKKHRARVVQRREYVCDFCGDEFDTAEELLGRHVPEEHPGVATPVKGAAAPALIMGNLARAAAAGADEAEPELAPEPPAPTEPEKAPDDEGEPAAPPAAPPAEPEVTIEEQAKLLGVALSVADRKGLGYNDADVVKDVQERIAAAKKRAVNMAGLAAARSRRPRTASAE